MRLYQEEYLSKNNCTMMRGIAALIIILHHSANYVYYGKLFDFLLKNIGASMTVIFFFYSGYGLLFGLKNKKGYLNSFFNSRIPSVVIPYLIVNFVYIGFTYLCVGGIDWRATIEGIKHGSLLVPYSWYVVAIVILYFLFWISFQWLKISKGVFVFGILNIAYIFVLYWIDFPEYWYNTSVAFGTGIFFCYYFDKIDNWLKRMTLIKLGCLICLFMGLVILVKKIDVVAVCIILKSIRAVIFAMIALICSMVLVRCKSKVVQFLGDISFELYLYQCFAFTILAKMQEGWNAYLWGMLAVLLTIVFAFIFSHLNKLVLNEWKKIVCN